MTRSALGTLVTLAALVLAAPAAAGEDAWEDFLAGVRSREEGRREASLRALLADPAVVPEESWARARRHLLDVMEEDREPYLRGLAGRCLALRPDLEARLRTVERLVVESDWRPQRDLLEALTGFREEALVALVSRRAVAEPREDVQALWVEALGRSDHPEAVATLRRLAGVRLPWVVAQAVALSLGRHPEPETVDALIELLWSEDPGIRFAARESLVRVTGERGLPAEAGPWVEWWAERREGFRPPDHAAPGPDGVPTVPAEEPSAPTYYDIPVRGRRIVFCLDVSASMWGPKFEAATAELSRAVRCLPTITFFDVLFFNEHPYVWMDEPVPAFPFQKLQCVSTFRELETKKYTNIFDTLERALGFAGLGRFALPDPPGVDEVFLLTDGEPNRGRYRDEKGILAGLAELDPRRTVRIHTISVGDTARSLMTAIAREHGGRHAHVDAPR